MLHLALPLMPTAALSSGLQAEPVPQLHPATGRRQDCDPDCGWPDRYKKRFNAYVMLPDGRDLGSALIAAGLARPYAGGQRGGAQGAGWPVSIGATDLTGRASVIDRRSALMTPPLRIVGPIGLAGALAGAPLDVAAQGSIERGRVMAERLCARCHAISGPGPSPVAKAPAFSTFERTWPVEYLAESLAEGFATGHGPVQIPVFDFTTEEIDDLLAFLKSVQE